MIRVCQSCGQKNRVPARHLADQGHCGKCQAPLEPVAAPLNVTTQEFREVIEGAQVPVLVDFWAEWCGPCRMAAPEVAKVASQVAGRALVLKVDTESQPELAAEFGVTGIPNFIVLKHGRVVFQQAGLVSAGEMGRWLANAEGLGGR